MFMLYLDLIIFKKFLLVEKIKKKKRSKEQERENVIYGG